MIELTETVATEEASQAQQRPRPQMGRSAVRVRWNAEDAWATEAEAVVDQFPVAVRPLIGDSRVTEIVVSSEDAQAAREIAEMLLGWNQDKGDALLFEDVIVPQTAVLLTDYSVEMWGHCDRWACVASSSAVQNFAAVCSTLGLLAKPVEIDPQEPFIAVHLRECDDSIRALAGVVWSLREIARLRPGSLVLDDQRVQNAADNAEAKAAMVGIAEQRAAAMDPARSEDEGYASTIDRSTRLVDAAGHPLRATPRLVTAR